MSKYFKLMKCEVLFLIIFAEIMVLFDSRTNKFKVFPNVPIKWSMPFCKKVMKTLSKSVKCQFPTCFFCRHYSSCQWPVAEQPPVGLKIDKLSIPIIISRNHGSRITEQFKVAFMTLFF
ncbi:hypothetical protein QTP88_009241 [Uroleucon formosanum]